MSHKMLREPTFAGKAEDKDRADLEYWAFEKTPWERIKEAWRLHCMNHNIPTNTRLDKTTNHARKR